MTDPAIDAPPETAQETGATDTAGRPVQLSTRGAARHEALIAAAAELFLAQGLDGVSVDGIVARAGGSKTNVYRQFGGKEGLFREVVQALSRDFLSPVAALDLAGVEPAAALGIIGRTLLRQLLDPRHLAFQRMVLGASGRFPDLMADWYAAGPRASQAMIGRVLEGHLADAARTGDAAVMFHDMIVTDPVNRAMMGQPLAWPVIEARIACAARTILA
ncbi:TetR/AcrR family transcriptional regulator [Frigidibacter sp. MR17.24]|uniref:TetR/AcrR family transcriptional regulator n=1 Tax=Frigidibacter sp. MR17.24 TaxID=3127345 RepID=UPI003012D170